MQYHYKAVTKTGKTVYGDLSAANVEQVLAIIRSKELIPIDVSVKNNIKACLQDLRWMYTGNVSCKVRSIFSDSSLCCLKPGFLWINLFKFFMI